MANKELVVSNMDKNGNNNHVALRYPNVVSYDGLLATRFGPSQLIQFGLPHCVTETAVQPFDNVSEVILMIPGNPGSIEMYRFFMAQLHVTTSIPVLGVSHPGLIRAGINQFKGPPTVRKLIEHKLEFVDKYIPPGVKVILVGHSLGTFIAIQMMRCADDRQRFLHSFLLMPVLEKFTETPGWKNIQLMLFFRPILSVLAMLLSFLRDDLLYRIMPTVVSDITKRTPGCIFTGILQLIDGNVVSNMLRLTLDEAAQIQDRDDGFLSRHLDRLSFLYCPEDHWSPLKMFRNLKQKFPSGDILMMDAVSHAFVMDISMTRDVVQVVSSKITTLLSNR